MTAVPVDEGKTGDNTAADNVGRPKIIVGVDGTAPSWDAFEWAAGEALRGNGRIVAVFVTSLVEPDDVLGATASLGHAAAEEARDQMAEELAAEVATRSDALGVETSFVRGTGDAARVLTEMARSEHADAMVVG